MRPIRRTLIPFLVVATIALQAQPATADGPLDEYVFECVGFFEDISHPTQGGIFIPVGEGRDHRDISFGGASNPLLCNKMVSAPRAMDAMVYTATLGAWDDIQKHCEIRPPCDG